MFVGVEFWSSGPDDTDQQIFPKGCSSWKPAQSENLTRIFNFASAKKVGFSWEILQN